jgi:rubrerythrin
MKVFVVEQERKIQCQSCDAMIDPFDFLWTWANRRFRFHQTVSELIKDRRELSEKIDELKRHEKNAKGRLKRAEAKLGEKWVQLTRTSPNGGRTMFMCRHCGQISFKPGKRCWGPDKQPQCNL